MVKVGDRVVLVDEVEDHAVYEVLGELDEETLVLEAADGAVVLARASAARVLV